jgi:LysM repeat protein
MKRGALAASTLMLVAILVSSCNQPYSQPSVVTNTPIDPNSLFATPAGGGTGLDDIQIFASQTVQAASTNAPLIATSTGSAAVTPQGATATSSPAVALLVTPTLTPTSTLAVPAGVTTAAPPPSGSRPPTYTLQREEFPFCIARRYGIDPGAILDASHLDNPDIYYAGLVLTIPAGPAWSVQEWGPIELHPHPTTYVVTGNADTTVYGVACKFGNVYPDAIVNANTGISLSSTLNAGQSLNIP